MHFRPKLSEKIKIDVLSTEKLSELTYQVVAKGDVLLSDTVSVPSEKHFQLEFQPTLPMLPKSNVVVFYITSDGEIISDSLKLEFGNELMNFVSRALN